MKIQTTYNFKSITAAAFAVILSNYDEASQDVIKEQFAFTEGAEKPYKRNPVTVDITLPEVVASFSDDEGGKLMKRAIQRIVEDFVKAVYIEEFQPVGQHDWDYIAAELAKSGRGGISIAVADELWQLAASTLKAWATASELNPKLIGAFTNVIAGKFTENNIRKHFGTSEPETLRKIEIKINQWASWILENDKDNADDLAVVYEAITKKMDKMLKRESGEILANLLD